MDDDMEGEENDLADENVSPGPAGSSQQKRQTGHESSANPEDSDPRAGTDQNRQ